MRWVVDGNAAGFAEFAETLDPGLAGRVTQRARQEIDRLGSVLDARREAGFVRQCHGDLHLRNIVLHDGEPTLFDGVEFNDEIACIDVLYDLAFLLMDLWRRHLPHHANSVWNGYLTEAGDLDGLPLMPLFLSCRAAVRAKTSATAARVQPDPARAAEQQALAREYLSMADGLLCPSRPSVIAVGGFSGSGKSTVAKALAPSMGAVPGALVLRSDEIRKRLCGVAAAERLGPEGYTPEVSARVYDVVADRARRAVAGGQSAIADAVYARAADREAIERVAAIARVPFIGLWLDAPDTVLFERVEQRRLDASDADAQVIRQQRAQDPGTIRWRRIDASRPLEAVLADITTTD
jgi:hypothetical protein